MSQPHLFCQRRFFTMFGCMALTAFNDNYYKNALIILITYVLASELHENAALLISVASACFIVPFLLFSGIAGTLADKYPKQWLVRRLKLVEFMLFAGAGIALMSHHITAMMAMLFLLGALAAFFGPVKYAILPELLKRNELLAGTGMVEGGSYVAILLGTIAGSLLVMQPHGTALVAASMAAVGLVGIVAAWNVPETRVAQPALKVHYNLILSIWQMLKVSFLTPTILTAILGISWFWAIGGTYLVQLAVFTKDVVGGSEQIVSFYMALFTIGIAIGSLTCAQLIRRVRAGMLPPLALIGVLICGLDLCFTGYGLPKPTGELIGFSQYFTSLAHYRLVADLLIMAFCGGLFVVPLYTQLQTDSNEAERARVIASNNVMNALFVTAASLLAAGLYALNLEVREVLLGFALLNIPVIARVFWK